jgi:hypothetical protein
MKKILLISLYSVLTLIGVLGSVVLIVELFGFLSDF